MEWKTVAWPPLEQSIRSRSVGPMHIERRTVNSAFLRQRLRFQQLPMTLLLRPLRGELEAGPAARQPTARARQSRRLPSVDARLSGRTPHPIVARRALLCEIHEGPLLHIDNTATSGLKCSCCCCIYAVSSCRKNKLK